jgi:formylglycine-generating enzyme required for sulfatase activity
MKNYMVKTLLMFFVITTSCELFEEKVEEIVLHPTTVIGPVEGAEEVSLLPVFVIGDYNASVNSVTTSHINIGEYSNNPAFLDFIIITKDTLDKSQFIILDSDNYSEYPYPPQPPYNEEIHKTVKAYFYPNAMLEPSTSYFWKVVHNAGDTLLNVIPYRRFKTAPLYSQDKSIEFINIQGGSFCMGSQICSQNEERNTRVKVNSFEIGKYEITNQQFCNFLNNTNGFFGVYDLVDIYSSLCKINFDFNSGRWKPYPGMEEYPIDAVQWNGALLFCQRYGGRLPTEAEWEYAAKGGQNSLGFTYSGGNIADEVAWFNSGSPQKVGTKKPNELGIFDMSGNVSEWCSDWFYNEPGTSSGFKWGSFENPIGPETGTYKVLRGGFAKNGLSVVYGRSQLYPATNFEDYTFINVGFRMLRN